MRIRIAVPLALLAAVLLPAHAAAAGAWTTFIRAYTYHDLLAEGDTVWCATGEAGLLRYDRRDSSFVAVPREPSGLASNSLSTLLRDRSGRLWVGTMGAGASRLSADGSKWDLVNRFDGLPSDSVTSFAARGDTLLIGTTRGIALWNGAEVAGALPDGFNPSPFTNGSDWITGIVIHGDSVWVSTQVGVYRSRFSEGLTGWAAETAFLPTGKFQGIVADDTTIVALEGRTPFRHRFDTGGTWAVANQDDAGALIAPAVRIHEDRGQILLTTEGGIYRWHQRNSWQLVTAQFASNPSDDRRSFATTVAPDGRVFAADRDGLRERMGDPDEWALRTPPGPPGNNILNVAVEGERVYVGTFEEGIGRFDGRDWRLWPPQACTLPCDTTFYSPLYSFALLVDKQSKKWFGCWGQAIDVLVDSLPTMDGAPPPHVTHHLYKNPALPNGGRYSCAWAAAADSQGGRWFGMETNSRGTHPARGLHYFDAAGNLTGVFIPDSSTVRGEIVRSLTVDRAGRLWVGYLDQGIDVFDINARPRPDTLLTPITVVGTERYAVPGLVAHGDTVWAFINKEIVAYRRTGNIQRIVSYPAPEGPGANAVNPLAVARDGTVWVGTANGIRVVDPRGNIHDFVEANSPLASNDVKAVRVDRATGVVWIGTARGLHRYDPGYRPPQPPTIPQLEFKIYPNPAWVSSIGIAIKLDGNATSYRGEVYDLHGRRVRRFAGVGDQGIVWDGKDDNGDVARPGIYFFRVEAGGKTGTSRLVLLR